VQSGEATVSTAGMAAAEAHTVRLELRDVAKRVLEHLRVPAQSVTPRITAGTCVLHGH
jgi:hypothetical protein